MSCIFNCFSRIVKSWRPLKNAPSCENYKKNNHKIQVKIQVYEKSIWPKTKKKKKKNARLVIVYFSLQISLLQLFLTATSA